MMSLDYVPSRLRALRERLQRDGLTSGELDDAGAAKRRAQLAARLRRYPIEQLEVEGLFLTRREQRLLPELLLDSTLEDIQAAVLTCLERYPRYVDAKLLWQVIDRFWGADELLERLADLLPPNQELEEELSIIVDRLGDGRLAVASGLVRHWFDRDIDPFEEARSRRFPFKLCRDICIGVFVGLSRDEWALFPPGVLLEEFMEFDIKWAEPCMAALVLEFHKGVDPTPKEFGFLEGLLGYLKYKQELTKDDPAYQDWMRYWRGMLQLWKVNTGKEEGRERYEFWRDYRNVAVGFDYRAHWTPPTLFIDFGTFGLVDFCARGKGAYHVTKARFDALEKFRVPKPSDLRAGNNQLQHRGNWQSKFRRKLDELFDVYGKPADSNSTYSETVRARLESLRRGYQKPPPKLASFPIKLGDPKQPDRAQLAVIKAPPEACLLVQAPPGYGKSHVACERVLHLVENERIEPHAILVISFTRVATRNLRERLRRANLTGQVDVRTIDQLAYMINERELLPGGYKESIDVALRRLVEEDVLEQRYEHIIVDEAQDTVGARAILICALLMRAVQDRAGFTIFHDPAQAIYDWSERDDTHHPSRHHEVTRLTALLEKNLSDDLERKSLDRLYRTSDARLISLMSQARPLASSGDHRHARHLFEFAKSNMVRSPIKPLYDHDTMILFRRRIDALDHASALAARGIQFGLRMGGLARNTIAPWAALVLGQSQGGHMSEQEFIELWDRFGDHLFLREVDPDRAWRACMDLGEIDGTGIVDIEDVARALVRSTLPPVLLERSRSRETLTVSTIHGSKGLEACRVRLQYFKRPHFKARRCEGARELYVAMSRAKQTLSIHPASRLDAQRNHEGRPWSIDKARGVFCVAIGLDADVERILPGSTEERRAQQDYLQTWSGAPVPVIARRGANKRYDFHDATTNHLLARSSVDLHRSLRRIKTDDHRGPSRDALTELRNLYWIDVVTSHIDPNQAGQTSPTNLCLTPIIIGLAEIPYA